MIVYDRARTEALRPRAEREWIERIEHWLDRAERQRRYVDCWVEAQYRAQGPEVVSQPEGKTS